MRSKYYVVSSSIAMSELPNTHGITRVLLAGRSSRCRTSKWGLGGRSAQRRVAAAAKRERARERVLLENEQNDSHSYLPHTCMNTYFLPPVSRFITSACVGRAGGWVLVRSLALVRLRAGRRNEGDEEGGGVEAAMRRVHNRQACMASKPCVCVCVCVCVISEEPEPVHVCVGGVCCVLFCKMRSSRQPVSRRPTPD